MNGSRACCLGRFIASLQVVLFIAIASQSANAQSSAQTADFLRQIATRIIVTNTTTEQKGLCHGFVQVVRGDVAFVATAKHCLEEPAGNSLNTSVSLRDLGLSITVHYANGTTGAVRHIAWSQNQDVVVLVSSFGERPDSYAGLCPSCRIYRTFGAGQRIPIESVLSAGAGAPVVSSGFVVSSTFGRYTVILPASPGTSGSPVVDLRGNLVGIVVTGSTFRGADAGWIAGIVLGSVVDGTTRYAVEHYQPMGRSPQPTSPPVSSPSVFSLSGDWAGKWTSDREGQRDGQFSATLVQDGNNVTGTVRFGGIECFGELQVSGGRSYANSEMFDLVAKDDDGHILVTFRVGLVSTHALFGTYNFLPSATGCDHGSGTVSAGAR